VPGVRGPVSSHLVLASLIQTHRAEPECESTLQRVSLFRGKGRVAVRSGRKNRCKLLTVCPPVHYVMYITSCVFGRARHSAVCSYVAGFSKTVGTWTNNDKGFTEEHSFQGFFVCLSALAYL